MGLAAGGRYSYTAGNARLYGSLGIEGTTYQIGFDAVRELLGSIKGKIFLDFGCGAGRSAAFLRTLGARHVYGVDHDQDMIGEAESRGLGGVTFFHSDGAIPLPDASADGAVSLNVFVEIRTPGEMRRACAEIARTLRPGGSFILESSSPMAFGRTFRSYSYPHAGPLRSGDTTACIVTTPDGQLVIQDTYWTEDDYTGALEHAGLTVSAIAYPRPRTPAAWTTDESPIPPSIVIKPRRSRSQEARTRPDHGRSPHPALPTVIRRDPIRFGVRLTAHPRQSTGPYSSHPAASSAPRRCRPVPVLTKSPRGGRGPAHRSRLWTATGMCPATVTKSMPRLSHRVIGFAGRRAARSAPNAESGVG